MITTNRRRQFGEVDGCVKVFNPNLYYATFSIQDTSQTVMVAYTNKTPTLKSIDFAPEGATVTAVSGGFKVSAPGSYGIYYSKASGGGYYNKFLSCVLDIRFPKNASEANQVFNWGGGGGNPATATYINIYFLTVSSAVASVNDNVSTNDYRNKFNIYVPKGTINDCITQSTRLATVYAEGRLHEWEFKIVED